MNNGNLSLRRLIDSWSKHLTYEQVQDLRNEFESRLKTAILDFLAEEGVHNPSVTFYNVHFYDNRLTGWVNITNKFGAINPRTKVLNKIKYSFYNKSCKVVLWTTDINFNKELADKIRNFIKNATDIL